MIFAFLSKIGAILFVIIGIFAVYKNLKKRSKYKDEIKKLGKNKFIRKYSQHEYDSYILEIKEKEKKAKKFKEEQKKEKKRNLF